MLRAWKLPSARLSWSSWGPGFLTGFPNALTGPGTLRHGSCSWRSDLPTVTEMAV